MSELYSSLVRRREGRAGALGLPPRAEGTLLGLISVAAFSLTLPMTRHALPAFGVLGITAGRAALAGLVAVALLWATRAPLPSRAELGELAVVALGTIVGFPLFATLSMGRVDAAHGAIVVGAVPLLTAIVGSRLGREHLPRRFWLASVAGSATVVVFALRGVSHGFAVADALLLAAGVSAAVGYAYSGRLARVLGGARVVCWALVLCLPVSLPLAALALTHVAGTPTPSRVGALLYLALVSQLAGFFSWNRALAVGGIARVSQLQLLQPFLTMAAAAVLLGEPLRAELFAFAFAVVCSVAVGSRRPGAALVRPAGGGAVLVRPAGGGAAALAVIMPVPRKDTSP